MGVQAHGEEGEGIVTGSALGLLSLLRQGVRIYDLAHSLFKGMPQSPRHPSFELVVPRRHGDSLRSDGSSGANDLIVTGSHVGTHIDALAHISQDGLLHGGVDAAEAQSSGLFSRHGIETVAPFFCRGVLLDVPAALGVECCEAGYEITSDDLARALAHSGQEVAPGDVVLVRTGWARHWPDRLAFHGDETGVPGVGEQAAAWLADLSPRAAGIDTVAFDRVPAGAGSDHFLPAHRVLLVEHGIHIVEQLVLEELAADGVHEFLFVLSPLKLVGATGSPVRPLAVVQEPIG